MKDNSVHPTGLLSPTRQSRLLKGIRQRFESSVTDHGALALRHASQIDEQKQTFDLRRQEKTDECRLLRRDTLKTWDEAEEILIRQYEAFAIQNRDEQNRLTAIFRRKSAEGKAKIEHKVAARCQAVEYQYAQRKNRPGQQRDKELSEIDNAIQPIIRSLQLGRELTVERLDHLPTVPPPETPEEDQRVPPPKNTKETVNSINELTKRCEETVLLMYAGLASKIIDSYYLPGTVVLVCILWVIGTYLYQPQTPSLVVAGVGTVITILIGFIAYFILMWPLKKLTRRLYPIVERLAAAADECAQVGRELSIQTASVASADLLAQRQSHLASAARWKTKQLDQLEKDLEIEQQHARRSLVESLHTENENFAAKRTRIMDSMRMRADAVANQITGELARNAEQLQNERDASETRRRNECRHLVQRLEQGVEHGFDRMTQATQQVENQFPKWETVVAQPPLSANGIDFVPVGSLQVNHHLKEVFQHPGVESTFGDSFHSIPIPETCPVVLHRRLHSGLIITAPPSFMNRAIETAHQILWRLLSGSPAGQCKLTLLDPLGRGQNFTSFMALADHDPSIVGHRVWTSDAQINERFAELSQHVEDVLQASLRDRFERIEDYNELAGSMAEPYRAVAAIGFPEGLTREGYKHLLALVESGLRCGIFLILVCDSTRPWPADMPMPNSEKAMRLAIDQAGDWHVTSDGLDELPFAPMELPSGKLRDALVEKIGTEAVEASRVEIPLESILNPDQAGLGNASDGVDIPVGSQGAQRVLDLDLGEGVRQHVLIAGKTGSGKSTLLHAIITSGAYRYTPDELQFYLLDFKKGVEFKPYADECFPHARVIGIESEREFGRSVLQRLDAELQHRGEKFRAAGVQELGEYRAQTGSVMPRIMLVVDEFQELFVRDDRLAGDCTMLLDRLVRQGRSFGMHVVLSSQSLAGAYSLPRATLGQMAVRIAMQCSESDAALILADDNTAARLINRPGEAIYNNAGGLIEGNQPFQVAWLSSSAHRNLLSQIAKRDGKFVKSLPPAVVFEGNRPCRWTPLLADAAEDSAAPQTLQGLLGEAVEIGPPVSVKLTRDTGRNLLVIAPPDSRGAVLATCLASFQHNATRLEVIYFDGNRMDDGESLSGWLSEAGISAKTVKLRDAEQEIIKVRQMIKERGERDTESEGTPPPVLVVIDPLERFRELRQEESFNFSLDAASSPMSGSVALQETLRDGPPVNVFVGVVCGSGETLTRWLPRTAQHDLELRVLGRMNAADSSLLIDNPMASELSAATMLMYDDADGQIRKFRQCDRPTASDVAKWLSE
ncbi:FtsK-like domain-containing protein [Planctomycetes bacterium CA13]|uniref:FtsK-like domain-containing protein n=1 Tax=Novipirellula herctigrandis TaxID=2527986 RepID=A0A5C5Z036_9BACT|nr:FtsK-like domain-containing protein [Planctomycetes bacterium CA13]